MPHSATRKPSDFGLENREPGMAQNGQDLPVVFCFPDKWGLFQGQFGRMGSPLQKAYVLGSQPTLVLERILWASDDLGPAWLPLLSSFLVWHVPEGAQQGRLPSRCVEARGCPDSPQLWFLPHPGSRLLSVILFSSLFFPGSWSLWPSLSHSHFIEVRLAYDKLHILKHTLW